MSNPAPLRLSFKSMAAVKMNKIKLLSYEIQKGSKLELTMLTPNLACFLPPNRVPVLAEITGVSEDSISIRPIGVSEDYTEIMDRKSKI
jgi:hypothetical protein